MNNDLVIHSNRKTGFVELICSMKSASLMYDEMVINEKKYLSSTVQDKPRPFRNALFFNTTPTCRQFAASLKGC